jgi:hypothetical protein
MDRTDQLQFPRNQNKRILLPLILDNDAADDRKRYRVSPLAFMDLQGI